MLFQPESPRWLVEHEQYDKAALILAHTSGKDVNDPSVVQTLEEIKQEFEGKEKLSIMQQVRGMTETRYIALRCFIPSLVMFFQQVSPFCPVQSTLNRTKPTLSGQEPMPSITSARKSSKVSGLTEPLLRY